MFLSGLGELFVVRNAGNTAVDDATVGSLEYAVRALRVPLVLVLGHSGCGAVAAAGGSADLGDGCLARHVARIADGIADPDPRHDACPVQANVRRAVDNLAGLGCLVVGAVYDMHTGLVEQIAAEGEEPVRKAPEQVGEAVSEEEEEEEVAGEVAGEVAVGAADGVVA